MSITCEYCSATVWLIGTETGAQCRDGAGCARLPDSRVRHEVGMRCDGRRGRLRPVYLYRGAWSSSLDLYGLCEQAMSFETFDQRLRRGWTIEAALTRPVGQWPERRLTTCAPKAMRQGVSR